MTSPRAYTEATLTQGNIALRLRPSLRAAMQLAAYPGGFTELVAKLSQQDTYAVYEVIKQTATNSTIAHKFIRNTSTMPLVKMKEWLPILVDLVMAMLPTLPNDTKQSSGSSEARPWSSFYDELFTIATGWLGWPPSEAWQATPQEIISAFDGHLNKLRAIHGGSEEPSEDTSDDAQRRQNIEAGLDPEFDRQGLRALKARLAGEAHA